MFHSKPSALALSLATVVVVCFTPLANAYDSIIDLGPGSGIDINNTGQVLMNNGVWNGTTFTPIPQSMGSNYILGAAINDAGQVVGSFGNEYSFPFILNGTSVTQLPTASCLPFLKFCQGQARAINNSGQVAGGAINERYQPVVWNGTTLTELNNLNGAAEGFALSINNAGQVAGISGNQATVWNGTTPTALGNLPRLTQNYNYKMGINDAGQVVGTNGDTGIIWNGTTPTALGTVGNGWSSAKDINNAGWVAGTEYGKTTANDVWHQYAALWTMQDGIWPTDLNTLVDPALGFNLTSSVAINDHGQILAEGVNAAGEYHVFLLSISGVPVASVPEPETYAMMLAGLGLVVFLTHYRKRAEI